MRHFAPALLHQGLNVLVSVEALVRAKPFAEAAHTLLFEELDGAFRFALATLQVLSFEFLRAGLAAEKLAG